MVVSIEDYGCGIDSAHLVELHNVEYLGGDLLGAMLLHEGVEVILSPAGNDQLGSILHQLVGKLLADTRGGTNDQDLLIIEWHDESLFEKNVIGVKRIVSEVLERIVSGVVDVQIL